MQKLNEKYEKQIRELAENRIITNNFKVFDKDARIVTRREIEGLGNCLVMINRAGETIVIDQHFEIALRNALGKK
jgi:hypothetical protein